MGVLVVVRHGRTTANARGLLLGRLDPSLDEIGVLQADAVAAAVGPVDEVIASPLARTRETAAAFGAPVTIDERWIELDYGELDGTPGSEVPTAVWDRWRADLDFAPPGGESLRRLGQRVRAGAEAAAARAEDATVVVVTHVSPVKASLAWALGVGDQVAWRSYVAPASITRIGVRAGRPVLQSFNETAHLVGTGA